MEKAIVILNDCYGKDVRSTDVCYPLHVILEAMEKYADQFRKYAVSGNEVALPCNHNYNQVDSYWNKCVHCGMMAPLGQ